MPLNIYKLIGDKGFHHIAHQFYARVANDELIGPMYPQHDLQGAEQRLGDFLIMRFGGPQTYLQTRGHPRLRMRHAPFPIDPAARNRWVQLMDAALTQTQQDLGPTAFPDTALTELQTFFHDSATFLINRPPPLPPPLSPPHSPASE